MAVYSKNPQNLEWIIELLSDSGADIVYAGFGSTAHMREGENLIGRTGVELRLDYSPADILRDIEADDLDLLIGKGDPSDELPCRHIELMNGQVGVEGMEQAADCIIKALKLPPREGWRCVE